jgi:hypothetical protein
MGDYSVAIHSDYATDQDTIASVWEPVANWIELSEPFERIREAIAEARQVRSRSA